MWKTAGTAYLSGAPEFILAFLWGSCCSISSSLCSGLQIIDCHFVVFRLVIVLSVLLQSTVSMYSKLSQFYVTI